MLNNEVNLLRKVLIELMDNPKSLKRVKMIMIKKELHKLNITNINS